MKFFSLARANALIPRIAPLVEELLNKRRDLAIKLLETTTVSRGVARPAPRLAGVRSPFPAPRFGEQKSEIVRLIHRIESFGCIVKDLDLGLLDFPSLRDGTPISLCWKGGEPSIEHWHGIDEGFRFRKPLDEVLRRGE
jgi:hypothetical protein